MSYRSNPTGDVVVADDDNAVASPGISWGAVLAGGVVAAAIAASLNILGAGIGAMTVDAVARDTPTASSIGMGAVIWMIVANTLALAVGGYTAARLSGTSSDTDGVLHGLAVWAVAFLVSAVLLAMPWRVPLPLLPPPPPRRLAARPPRSPARSVAPCRRCRPTPSSNGRNQPCVAPVARPRR